MYALLLCAAGCSFGLTPAGPSDTVAVDTSPTRIDAVDPPYATPDGGTSVTITGAGFVGAVTVTFGGADAETISAVDSATLVVTTPRVSSEGTVDVKVISDNGVDTAVAAFTFTRDADTDADTDVDTDADADADTDTDTDTGPEYAGMTTGYLTFDYSDNACPLCFGLPFDTLPTIGAAAAFHAPVVGSWFDWVPADGTCVTNPAASSLATTWLDAGTPLSVSDGSLTFGLTGGTGGAAYAATGLVAAQFSQGVDWDLVAPGGTDLAAFSLADSLHTPLAFAAIEPGSITGENPDTAYSAGFVAAGTTVTWTPAATGDFVTIELVATTGGNVVCRGADTGSLTVPGIAIAGWAVGTELAVHLTRWNVGEGVLDTGAVIELVSRYEVIGTGSVR